MRLRRNMGRWDRAARLAGGCLMLLCGLFGLPAAGTGAGFAPAPAGIVLALAGMVALLTGLAGYCPACAAAGRRPVGE